MALFHSDSLPRSRHTDEPALRGVALFILEEGSRILTVRERTDKALTGKRKGEYGIPSETLQPNETWGEAAVRCIHEELGVPLSRVSALFCADPAACFVGEARILGVVGRAYEMRYIGTRRELFSYVGDGEVGVDGFRTLPELRAKKLRSATALALKMYSPTARITDREALVPVSSELLTHAKD